MNKNLVFFFLFVSFRVVSQHWQGLIHSNYAGTNALSENPAFAVDSRFKLYLHIASAEVHAINNYLSYDAPFSLTSLANGTVPDEYKTESGKTLFKQEYLKENFNGANKNIYLGSTIKGPSLLYTFNRKSALGLQISARMGVGVTDASEGAVKIARYGNTRPDVVPNQAQDLQFDLNANAILEYTATYARVFKDDDDWFFKMGISAKRIVGLYSLYANATNGSYELVADPNDPTRKIVQINSLNMNYGFVDGGAYKNFTLTPGWLTGFSAAGSGWGLDLGLVYEFRPDYRKYIYREKGEIYKDPTRNKYKYRVSLAFTDIGYVRYANPAYTHAFTINKFKFLVDENRFSAAKDLDGVVKALNETMQIDMSSDATNFTVFMPATIRANIDCHYKKNWYINAALVQPLKIGGGKPQLHSVQWLAITPRYESRWFELAIPFSLVNNFNMFTVGFAARLGILSFGTDHIGALLNIGSQRGANFYTTLGIPIFMTQPKNNRSCEIYKRPNFLQRLLGKRSL